jgi:glucose-1-phosphate adenylyltransferase
VPPRPSPGCASRSSRPPSSASSTPIEDGHIRSFREKPTDAVGLPDDPSMVYASMGNYVFTTQALVDALQRDAADEDSSHDMGGNIITEMVERGDAGVYDFTRDNEVPGETERDHGYWRDVGTIDAYYDAHMDLISVHPIFNLYNLQWPIYSWNDPLPPAKFVFDRTTAGAARSTRWSVPVW